jgi:hypothetical protein
MVAVYDAVAKRWLSKLTLYLSRYCGNAACRCVLLDSVDGGGISVVVAKSLSDYLKPLISIYIVATTL